MNEQDTGREAYMNDPPPVTPGKAFDPPPYNRPWHQKKRWIIPLGVVMGFIIGVAGESPETQTAAAPQEVVTEQVTEQVTEEVTEKVTETVTEYVTETPEEDDVELPPDLEKEAGRLGMMAAWDNLGEEDRQNVCIYYTITPQDAIDTFMDSADSDIFTRKDVRAFFDENC
jgi:hypothetical protein